MKTLSELSEVPSDFSVSPIGKRSLSAEVLDSDYLRQNRPETPVENPSPMSVAPNPHTPTATAPSPTTCEHCGSLTNIEIPDATKLNALVEHVRSRLSTDVYGNHFIQGTRLSNDRRHGDLGELFTLMNKLDSFKASMDTYIALHAPKEVVKAEKPAKLTENMTSVIRNVVEEQVGDRLRDLSIRCGRLEEELNSANAKMVAAQGKRAEEGKKVKALEGKMWRAVGAVEAKVEGISECVQSAEAVVEKVTDHEDQLKSLSSFRRTTEMRECTTNIEISALGERLDLIEAIIDGEGDEKGLTDEFAKLQERIGGHGHRLSKVEDSLWEAHSRIDRRSDEIVDLEDKVAGRPPQGRR